MKLLLFLTPIGLLAQSGLERPSVGTMLDRHGVLRPVYGIAGSFLADEGTVDRVLAAACSALLCAVKLEDSVLVGDTEFPAPHGSAVIAVEGAEASFYFTETRQFVRVRQGSLRPIDLTVDGEVISLRANSREMAVRREDGVRIISMDGAVLDFLPADAQTALLIPDAVVYSTDTELVLRHSDESEQRFQAAGIRDLFAMSDSWVEARSAKAIFALRTEAGREQIYLLPESGVLRSPQR